ncbi:MAG: hypothetical protein Q9M16_08165 [Mariprofundus sp.]|nr:hypothetical protein [Mariprofundus sp.]
MLILLHADVSDAELDAHVTRLLAPEYAQPEKKGLVVLCENMESAGMSFHGIFSAGKRMHKASFREGGQLAIVAHSTVAFGLAKIYQMAAEVLALDEIRVMRGHELGDAMRWLGIEDMSKDIRAKIKQLEGRPSDAVAMQRSSPF